MAHPKRKIQYAFALAPSNDHLVPAIPFAMRRCGAVHTTASCLHFCGFYKGKLVKAIKVKTRRRNSRHIRIALDAMGGIRPASRGGKGPSWPPTISNTLNRPRRPDCRSEA